MAAVKSRKGSLAQLVEQLTFNQLVAGSNPARPTNVKRRPKGAFLLCAELNDSTKLSGTILNNAAALARRASLRMRRVSLQQVRVERSETTEPLAATARRASKASHPARPTNVKRRPKGAFLLSAFSLPLINVNNFLIHHFPTVTLRLPCLHRIRTGRSGRCAAPSPGKGSDVQNSSRLLARNRLSCLAYKTP